jgi:predicted short-subunit dehydrogenase-like oxidoreductase (DUF2520 family)
MDLAVNMPAAAPSTSWTDVAIIGAGAVARAFAHRLVQCGYTVSAVLSRRREPAEALAQAVEAPVGSSDWGDVPFQTPLLLVCVPDDAIEPVANRLANLERPWASITVAHTSGARTAAALDAVAARGASTLSLHPMQTLTLDSPPSALEGIYVGIEGEDDDAVTQATSFVRDLGAEAITIPAAAKTRYHLAGVFASNGLVALMGLVNEMLASAGLDPDIGSALVGPLVQSTWRNIAATSPEAALTGPVVRGDTGTVVAHLGALATHLPHLLPAYAALSNEMVRLAVRGGRLSPERAEPLLDALSDALHRDDGESDGESLGL